MPETHKNPKSSEDNAPSDDEIHWGSDRYFDAMFPESIERKERRRARFKEQYGEPLPEIVQRGNGEPIDITAFGERMRKIQSSLEST